MSLSRDSWFLRIQDVRESDAGKYLCQLNTEPSSVSISGSLSVVGNNASVLQVEAKNSIDYHQLQSHNACNIHLHYLHYWTKIVWNEILVGQYQYDLSANLLSAVPPNILDDTSSADTLATEGSSVSLSCDAVGTPR